MNIDGIVQAVLEASFRSALLYAVALVALLLVGRRLASSTRHATLVGAALAGLLLPALRAVLPAFEALPPWVGVLANPIAGAPPSGGQAPQALIESDRLLGALAAAWLLGASLAGAPIALGLLRIAGARRRSTAPTGRVADAARSVGALLGADGRVRVRLCADRSMPASCGLLRGVVLLPHAADEWSESRLRAVLLHEMAHTLRRDALTTLLSRCVCVMYWFNPLVWFAHQMLIDERERATDDVVVRHIGRRCEYAEDLLAVARAYATRLPIGVASVAPTVTLRGIEGRIRHLLDPDRSRDALRPAHAFTLAVGGALLALCAAVADATPSRATITATAAEAPGGLRSPAAAARYDTVMIAEETPPNRTDHAGAEATFRHRAERR